jgi:hypothetical protein
MLALTTLLAVTLQAQAPRAVPADSYADSATRELVRQARGARERNERLVTAYRARVSQRLGIGIRALSRDRMLYRQELVADISWRRDSISTVRVVGAREGVPVATRGDQVPENLEDDIGGLVIDPAADYLRFLGSDNDDESFIYPLRVGGEALYRFRRGQTTEIGLPDGRRITLVGLEVIPRRADYRLISGTLWFDAATYNLVRAVFRPARPFEMRRDLAKEDLEDVPAFVNAKGEVKYVTLEYGLYENRWWMPRYVGIDAVGSMGTWLNTPFRVERVYSDYEVDGGTPPDSGSTFRPAGSIRRQLAEDERPDSATRRQTRDSLRAVIEACVDSMTAAADSADGTGERISRSMQVGRCRERNRGSRENLTVVVPDDTALLLIAPELGAPILQMGDVVDAEELLALRDAIGELPGRPWETTLQLPRGASALLEHARYNRIEALSLGLGGQLDLGKAQLQAVGRIGLADGEPNGTFTVQRLTPRSRYTLAGYRRLAVANPENRPHGAVNSFMGLFAGRDDGEYYRSLGVELTAENLVSRWWSGRLWFQDERAAEVGTTSSLPRLLDGDRTFRPNIMAERASQLGASMTLRGTRVLSPTVTLGAQADLRQETGDFDFGTAAATLRLLITPAGPLAGGVTLSAGSSHGTVPVQGRFYLGGSGTLRGYAGGAMAGDAYWLVRGELGNAFPAARLTLFSDVGWAGSRGAFGRGRPLVGAGIGASFLDGLVRIDLARALRAPTGWRLEFYFDGLL